MLGIFKTVSVKPHQIGYLYKNNRLFQKLEPGRYRFLAGVAEFTTVLIPTTERFVVVTHQEVLTQDNIALRFSYGVRYAITHSDRFVSAFNVFQDTSFGLVEAEQRIHHLTQVHLRRVIAQIDSEQLNQQREHLLSELPTDLVEQVAAYGIELQELMVRDITFPKSIQDLFARRLESKIRAQSDLENARTAVATARTLKNAAELMKDNENIQFLQLLETLTKIAASGKHTFVFGELNRNGVQK